MASEDNFLKLDPCNHDTELTSLLATSSLSLDDIEDLYYSGAMSKEEFEYCFGWFEFYSSNKGDKV